jgi:hypothetical protein
LLEQRDRFGAPAQLMQADGIVGHQPGGSKIRFWVPRELGVERLLHQL